MEYNRVSIFEGDTSLGRLVELKWFLENLKTKLETNRQTPNSNRQDDDIACCIYHANEVDTLIFPCNHKSCW